MRSTWMNSDKGKARKDNLRDDYTNETVHMDCWKITKQWQWQWQWQNYLREDNIA